MQIEVDYEEIIRLLEESRNSFERRLNAANKSPYADHKAEIPYLQKQVKLANQYIASITMEKVRVT